MSQRLLMASQTAGITYTRVDPTFWYSGNRGHWIDEPFVKWVQDSNRAAKIEWQTTTKRSGIGAFKFTGGNQGGDCCIMTDDSSSSMLSNDIFAQIVVRFESFHTAAIKANMMPAVVFGSDGVSPSGEKPSVLIDQNGHLWLQGSNGAGGVDAGALSLNTWYTIVLHARGGQNTALTHELWLYNGLTGAQINYVSSAWNVGTSAGSNEVVKYGNSGGGNTTGLVYYFEDCIAYKGLTTNPGPCQIFTKTPTSTVGAGNWTAEGDTSIHLCVDDNKASCRSISDLTTTAASPNISSATANFTADDIGAVFQNCSTIGSTNTIASVTDTQNAVLSSNASGSGTNVTAIIVRRGHDGDTTFAKTISSTASNAELGLSNANIPSNYQIHTVAPMVTQKHSGTAGTIRVKVKQGGSTTSLDFKPNTSLQWLTRKCVAQGGDQYSASASLDPATSQRWTASGVDTITVQLADEDSLPRECDISRVHVDVIAAMVP